MLANVLLPLVSSTAPSSVSSTTNTSSSLSVSCLTCHSQIADAMAPAEAPEPPITGLELNTHVGSKLSSTSGQLHSPHFHPTCTLLGMPLVHCQIKFNTFQVFHMLSSCITLSRHSKFNCIIF
ncbi:uncharacterized protein LOC123501427 [Portunus trituberculatus]|uniref:uncharacterized protein LOC123501427 n=1 Tax=Portunus trituberculatus TaxID=210409 RepID=UPI001E1CD66B|nr:uncharacterized protein LOC123501427 [Portunus trituberculatus]